MNDFLWGCLVGGLCMAVGVLVGFFGRRPR